MSSCIEFKLLKSLKDDADIEVILKESELTAIEDSDFAKDLIHLYTCKVYRAKIVTEQTGKLGTNLILNVNLYYYKFLNRGWLVKNSTLYHVGCMHTFKELNIKECQERNISHLGNCWHVYECTNCKHIESYDSSD